MKPGGVLVVARDAGPAFALAPVVAALAATGRATEIVAWDAAAAGFAEHGLAVRPFREDPEPEEIETLLASTEVAAVLTGTSLRVERDGRFWRAAADAGIPSVALLDHWKLYAERFSRERPFDTLPSVVAVMDEIAERELVAKGCPPERIRITGQPRFDGLAALDLRALRHAARRELGIEPEACVVVFASEPRGLPYDDGTGYTQESALSTLLEALEGVAADAVVLVKLHPLEEAAPQLPGTALDVRVLRDFPISGLAAAADVFCGMTSIVLLDAAYLGVPTISVRPEGGADHFVDAHADLIATATTSAQTRATVESALVAGRRPQAFAPQAGAALRVCSLLRELAAADGIMGR